MPSITFQVVAQDDFLRKMADPRFWETYKMYVVREITEGALATIRTYASRLWKNPSGGGLDQSWSSQYDIGRAMGSITNSKPYAYWLNTGVRPHRMTYLLNAHNAWYMADGTKAAVIPIKTGAGKADTVFRVVTARHMSLPDGVKPWWHRGIVPKNFLELGMEEYRQTRLRTDFEGLTVRVLGLVG